MTDIERAIQAAEAAPEGPAIGAFFDLDGTLVKGFTALAYLREELQTLGARALYELARDVQKLRNQEDGDTATIERAAMLIAGRTVDDMEALSKRVFKKRVAATLRPGVRDLVRAHRRRGHTVVMATAATGFQAAPVAQDLEISNVLSTHLEVVDGTLTGRVVGAPTWGRHKAKAVRDFATANDVDLTQSFGYANGDEDQDFLEALGHPHAVCPDRGLARFAKSVDMPILQFEDPPSTDLRSVFGTLASLGTMNAGVLAAVAGKMISGGRWKPIGPTLAAAGDLTLKVAGIEVRAQGKEHIEAARPAVFIVNHQSNLDPLVAGVLVRHDFTVVGKQEIAWDPRAFAMSWLDVALIDRTDSESARASLTALVERIQGGESVMIWPEGTRMPTPRLGTFKKGGFHLAMDAGVPIVPIVLRNTGELWPKGQVLVHPGTVDVCVLPPISTADWKRENLDAHIAEVRAQFEQTLENWPIGG
ncbi:MAG: HAD-IB family hydrolase [Myxococcota bacterium]